MFEPKADRNLSKLDERFKKKVVLFMQEVQTLVFVTEAWRSQKRQNYLRKKGLSKVITSYHQKGLAIDIAFKDDPRTKQTERELYPKDFKRWREVADIANKYEIDWGYDLWNWDKPHFQDNGKEYIPSFGKTMNKEEKKTTDACVGVLSALWSKLSEEGKKIASEAAELFRKLK